MDEKSKYGLPLSPVSLYGKEDLQNTLPASRSFLAELNLFAFAKPV